MQQHAVQVAHFHPLAKARCGDNIRVWARHTLREQVRAARRHRGARKLPRLADRTRLAIKAQQHHLHRDVVLEQACVVLVAQQVLVGAQLAYGAIGFAVLQDRTGRHAARLRWLADAHRAPVHQQAAAVGQPVEAAREYGRQRLRRQLARTARGDIDQPQFHCARVLAHAAIERHVGKSEMALVGRPAQVRQPQVRRQTGNRAFLVAGDIEQRQAGAERKTRTGIRARVDAQAGQFQFGLRHLGDAGQRGSLHHGSGVAAWAQAQCRRPWRIDNRLQRFGRQAVAGVGRALLRRGGHQAGGCGRHGALLFHGGPFQWPATRALLDSSVPG